MDGTLHYTIRTTAIGRNKSTLKNDQNLCKVITLYKIMQDNLSLSLYQRIM